MRESNNHKTSGSRSRVLLADDHSLLLERVARLLRPTFDVVGVTRNGLEMVDAAIRLKPDIIVADIAMPELDGIQAAHQLREMGTTAAIVFLTVHESSEFIEACLAEGARGYVMKSRMKSDLIPAINAALSGHCFISLTTRTTT